MVRWSWSPAPPAGSAGRPGWRSPDGARVVLAGRRAGALQELAQDCEAVGRLTQPREDAQGGANVAVGLPARPTAARRCGRLVWSLTALVVIRMRWSAAIGESVGQPHQPHQHGRPGAGLEVIKLTEHRGSRWMTA
jgi:hypothetical protein